jgi:antitoxin component YwqK of YwqJK toxin-antitoxin module
MKYLLLFLITFGLTACQNKDEKSYYADKTLKSECPLKDGVKEGLEKGYYKDGELQYESYYASGKLEGSSRWYFTDGKIEMEINYHAGKKNGVCKEYYNSASLKTKVEYRNDTLANFLEEHFPNGKYKSEKYYSESGELFHWNTFNENGELIDTDQHPTLLVHGDPTLNKEYVVDIEMDGIQNGIVDGFFSQRDNHDKIKREDKLLIKKHHAQFSFVPKIKGTYEFKGYVIAKNANDNLKRFDFQQEFKVD